MPGQNWLHNYGHSTQPRGNAELCFLILFLIGVIFGTVSAITSIKAKYRVLKNWNGDPCGPRTLAWDGLTCTYATSNPPKITGV